LLITNHFFLFFLPPVESGSGVSSSSQLSHVVQTIQHGTSLRNNSYKLYMLCEESEFSPIHFLSSQISISPWLQFIYLENKWLDCALDLLCGNCTGGNPILLCELTFLHNHTSFKSTIINVFGIIPCCKYILLVRSRWIIEACASFLQWKPLLRPSMDLKFSINPKNLIFKKILQLQFIQTMHLSF
jgi:hypothetical protein